MHNMDRLAENVGSKGVVCLGLDTSLSYLPAEFAARYQDAGEAIFAFNKEIIDATHDVVACYKTQIAYYEALGMAGMLAFSRTLKYIKHIGQLNITDCKRGDIKESAAMYAKAHFEGDFESDFMTLNPYMGLDTLEPYKPYFEAGKGCFVLLRTSNQGAHDIQYLDVNGSGGTRKVYQVLGERLQQLGESFTGTSGYTAVGMVMGATHAEEGQALRSMLDKTFLLIPGYGAQGGKAEDVALYLKDGNGGVVNSSRAILTAHKKHEDGGAKFAHYARQEAVQMNQTIKAAGKPGTQ